MNPFQNIQSAVIHIENPPEALAREQAVIAYTVGSAFAEMAEKQKGTLVPRGCWRTWRFCLKASSRYRPFSFLRCEAC
jgi:hypothetical protein